MLKHAAAVIFFSLAGLMLGGCDGQLNNKQEALPKKSQGQGEAAPRQQETTQRGAQNEQFQLGVGETAELQRGQYKGLKLTLMEAFTTQGGQYDRSGRRGADTYLVTRFRAQNEGRRTVEMFGAGLDFLAYNQDSYELDSYTLEAQYTTGANREDQELSGQVRPGGDVVGTVAFAVRNTDSVLVEYTPVLEPLASWEVGPVANLPTGELGAPSASATASPPASASPSATAGSDTSAAEASVVQAVEDYYQAVDRADWTYTYANLDSQTQIMFTEEEWYRKNQYFADIEGLDLASMDVQVNGSASDPVVNVTVYRTFTDGTSITRDTLFVKEGGEWKHRFTQEEIDLYKPGTPYEEWVAAQ